MMGQQELTPKLLCHTRFQTSMFEEIERIGENRKKKMQAFKSSLLNVKAKLVKVRVNSDGTYSLP